MEVERATGHGVVVACSALKRSYRDRLIGTRTGVRLVYLHGSRELLAARIAARHGHFMPASQLDDQLATLEPPTPDENAISVDVVVFCDDDVAEIDAYPEHDPLFLGRPCIALGHPTLHGDRAGDGLNDAWKLDQDSVAGRLDDAAFVLGDFGVDEFTAMVSEPP